MNKFTKIILIAVAVVLLVCVAGLVVISFQTSATQEKFDALTEVCRGGHVAGAATYTQGAGTHRGMGIIKRESGTLQVYPYAYPDAALAQEVAEAELVLCLTEPKEVLLERCPYTKEDSQETEGIVERYVYERELSVVEAKTGKVLATKVLRGEDPRECLEEEAFQKGEDTLKVTGEEVSDAAMQDWVRPYVLID